MPVRLLALVCCLSVLAACSNDAPTETRTCVAGAACTPSEACRTGKVACNGTQQTCVADVAAADGTACAGGGTCRAGTCVPPCHAGDACEVTGAPCVTGTTSCEGGVASCVAGDAKPDGTDCGGGLQCTAGQCGNGCVPEAPCIPDFPCHAGAIDCTHQGTCRDTGAPANDGAACADGKICSAGECVPCSEGAACALEGDVCHAGQISCAAGGACVAGAPVEDGTACGNGMTCSSGACIACEPGGACVPAEAPCTKGTFSCAGGVATCVAGTEPAADGTSCGEDQTCSGGACVSCQQDAPCTPADACHVGKIDCATGSPVCTDTHVNAPNGTVCGDGQVCRAGTCNACDAGASCTPATKCHQGVISCATGTAVCTDAGASANGTPCGTNQVCNGGSCTNCTAGGSCTPQAECQKGTYTCETGVRTCKASGADTAQEGQACAFSQSGVCTGGACACQNPGEVYVQGDCAVCPEFTDGYVRVNADPTVGSDDACCGRTEAHQFGGPCLTVHQALVNVPGPGYTVAVKPLASGDVSPKEVYPLPLHDGVTVAPWPGYTNVCLPGAAGKNVFEAKTDVSNAVLTNLTVGTSCNGNAPGAADGLLVARTPGGGEGLVQVQYSAFKGMKTAIHIDGGHVEMFQTAMGPVSDTGVRCESTIDPAATSTFNVSQSWVRGAKKYDVFAGTGCLSNIAQSYLGSDGASPCTKTDRHGLWAQGTAHVTLWQDIVTCQTDDGITLRNDPALTTNAPVVELNSSQVLHCGCVGLYAEAGKLTAYGNLVSDNHWGVVQRSTASSTDPNDSLVKLTGLNPADQSPLRNTFKCNDHTEPGSCCTATVCRSGYDVWNNSGLKLDATYNFWQDSPVSQCACDLNVQSCRCTGSAQGQNVPPDGTSIVNSPAPNGTPTTTITNYATTPDPSCL